MRIWRALCAFMACGIVWGQAPAPAAPSPGPEGMVATYASYHDVPSVKWGTGYSVAVRATNGIYSYTSNDVSLLHGKTSTTTRTGVTAELRSWGPVHLLILGTAGVTQGTSLLPSASGGFLVGYLSKRRWAAFFDWQGSNTTGHTARLGFGRTWGK